MAAATTELEAINSMLSAIGEAPLNSLSDVTGFVDAVIAQNILKEVSLQVQEEGWHFNTETNVTLLPDLTTKEITLPANAIQVDTVGVSRDIDVVARGTKLYNKTNRSYQFNTGIKVEIVSVYDFEELPQAARHYVSIRAGRVFQGRVVGSPTLASFSEQDELRARAAVKKMESDTGDHNMLSGSYSVMRILNR